jgi:hypothetical protein
MEVRVEKKNSPKKELIAKNQKKLTDIRLDEKNATHPMDKMAN